MITNLVFKRTVNIEGSARTEMKIIEVDIPELRSGEGWTLVSTADKVSTINIERGCEQKESITTNRDADPDKATKFLNNIIKMTGAGVCNCAQTDKSTLDAYKETLAANSVNIAYKPSEDEEAAHIREYESPVVGTACLIRKNNTIRIAYREGKAANINNPNKVCINDQDKQNFFNAVRAWNAGNDNIKKWQLVKLEGLKNSYYDTWNSFMDDEYIRQKKEFLRKRGR